MKTRKKRRVLESLDSAFMAAALAQAGEVEMARDLMIQDRNDRNCCGALYEGSACVRESVEQCTPALEAAL